MPEPIAPQDLIRTLRLTSAYLSAEGAELEDLRNLGDPEVFTPTSELCGLLRELRQRRRQPTPGHPAGWRARLPPATALALETWCDARGDARDLETLTRHLEEDQARRDRVRGAAWGMLQALVAAGALVGGLLVLVVPTVEEAYRSMNIELPLATQWVLILAGLLPTAPFSVAVGLRRLVRSTSLLATPSGRRALASLAAVVPPLRRLMDGYLRLEIAQGLLMLASQGIPLERAAARLEALPWARVPSPGWLVLVPELEEAGLTQGALLDRLEALLLAQGQAWDQRLTRMVRLYQVGLVLGTVTLLGVGILALASPFRCLCCCVD